MPPIGRLRHCGMDLPPISFLPDPPAELRQAVADGINAFHARTVPRDARSFCFAAHDDAGLAGAIFGQLAWEWMFVAGLFVTDAWRGRGLGSALLSRAEIYAAVQGCGNAWLDTFQARSFYLRHGWEVFGSLPGYPAGQTRHFMRKGLLGGS